MSDHYRTLLAQAAPHPLPIWVAACAVMIQSVLTVLAMPLVLLQWTLSGCGVAALAVMIWCERPASPPAGLTARTRAALRQAIARDVQTTHAVLLGLCVVGMLLGFWFARDADGSATMALRYGVFVFVGMTRIQHLRAVLRLRDALQVGNLGGE